MTVYLDLVMGLNFLVDLMLLLGTNRLCGYPAQWRRILPAAGVGGLYGGLCVLRRLRFLAGPLWRMVVLIGMGILAFGWSWGALRRGCIFLLLSFALGGIASGIQRSAFPAFLLGLSGLWLLCTVAGSAVDTREYAEVVIHWQGRCIRVTALRDTGNTLRDPVSGESVLILAGNEAVKLTGLSLRQLSDPVSTLAAAPLPGLRLIPYRAVGCGGGMLLAMAFEDCTIGGKRQKRVVAFAPAGLDGMGMYQALTGGAI